MDIKVQNSFKNDNGEYVVCKVFENHGELISIGTVLEVPNKVSQARADELVKAEVVKFTGTKKMEKAESVPEYEIPEDEYVTKIKTPKDEVKKSK